MKLRIIPRVRIALLPALINAICANWGKAVAETPQAMRHVEQLR